MRVFIVRALLFGVYIGAPAFGLLSRTVEVDSAFLSGPGGQQLGAM